jgi:hypothetical protein
VLDDKRRDWLKKYCEVKGAVHVTRPDNLHAKAGNLNHGLKVSNGELVAIFDADFVPYRQFLRRTAPFFREPDIGLVQTPQHFFNKDPVQSNLGIERVWPDEQRLFFDEMAASRDAWDVSFCCGSCSILRRQAIDAIGGIPTVSITEDLLTTPAMLNKGYKTRYLNERLSMGLAAEKSQRLLHSAQPLVPRGNPDPVRAQRTHSGARARSLSAPHVHPAELADPVRGPFFHFDRAADLSLDRRCAALFHQHFGYHLLPAAGPARLLLPHAVDHPDAIFADRVERRRGILHVSPPAHRDRDLDQTVRDPLQGHAKG